MAKLAVIKTGGKQYKIKEGDTLKIEKVLSSEGEIFEFDEVLMIGEEDGSKIEVGTPLLEGKKVTAKILEQGRDKKITGIKYKAKTRYKVTYGHRQPFTKIQIEKIG
jgi:large subunit ribosomal protein L21